ncbi:MAG TPA: amidohydrolase family protein [Gemmatimonadales bacterium]
MIRLVMSVLLTTAIPPAAQQQRAASQVIAGGTLIDGTGAAPIADAVVVVQDGRIACVGPRGSCAIPDNARMVDVTGKWITPGLVDAHVHFSQTGWVDGRPDALDLRANHPYERTAAMLHDHPERFFQSYLCSGVTSVFDVGGYPWTWDLQRRTAGRGDAPLVRAAGPLLSTIDFWLNLPGHRQFIAMADEATVRQTVRAHVAWGAAAIKIWYIMRPGVDTARVSALVHATGDEARARGVPLIVHATGLWEAKDAVRAGARLLVHSVFNEPVDDEFLALAREHDTIYTPTLTVRDGYRQVRVRQIERGPQPFACVDPITLANVLATDTVPFLPESAAPDREAARAASMQGLRLAQENLARVHAAGISVVMGTDAGNPLTLHGASVFMEMEAMQRAGMTSMEVLVASTRNGARALGVADIGTVEPGNVADLLVVDADPTRDIAAMRRIALVMRAGRIHQRRDLEFR